MLKQKALKRDREKNFLIIGSVMLGILAFGLIYGFKVVDVTYDDWLFTGGDLSQHYFGWLYYRQSEWKFPIGMIQGLTDLNTCIIYTDSIPIFAIFFKVFSRWLPTTFQYFGIWGLLSFILMSVLSAILIYKFSKNIWSAWIGSLFFTISPYVLQRMFAHTALGAQWVIVLAMIFWIYDIGRDKISKKIIAWSFLLVLVSVIHLYFVPMIVVFAFADAIRIGLRQRKVLYSIGCFGVPIISAILVLFIVGAFAVSGGEFDAEGLGYYSANINTFFNPIYGISMFMKQLPCGDGQYEGMGYLGLGMIFLIVIGACIIINHKVEVKKYLERRRLDVLLNGGIICIFLILAFSPTIMFGHKVIFNLKWPAVIMKLLGIFRSSGRFIWPVCYLLFTFLIWMLCKKNGKKNVIVLLSVMCLVQMVDLSPYICEKHETFSTKQNYEVPLTEEAWSMLLDGKDKVVFLPYDSVWDDTERLYAIASIAYDKKVRLNSFYVSRKNLEAMDELTEEYLKKIENDMAEENEVYIFPDVAEIWNRDYKLYFYEIDGIVVGVKKAVQGLETVEGVTSICTNKEMSVKLDDMRLLDLQDKEKRRGLEVRRNQMLYGPYYSMKEGYYECEIIGKNLSGLSWQCYSNINEETFYCKVLEESDDRIRLELVLTEDIDDMEIRMENLKEESVYIEQMTIDRYEE